jgi:hypothetical protein
MTVGRRSAPARHVNDWQFGQATGVELTRTYGERAQAEAKYFMDAEVAIVRTAICRTISPQGTSLSDSVLCHPLILRIPLRIPEASHIIFNLIFNQLMTLFESSIGTKIQFGAIRRRSPKNPVKPCAFGFFCF